MKYNIPSWSLNLISTYTDIVLTYTGALDIQSQPSVFFFFLGRKIANWRNCLKLLARFPLFLQKPIAKNNPFGRSGGACRRMSVYWLLLVLIMIFVQKVSPVKAKSDCILSGYARQYCYKTLIPPSNSSFTRRRATTRGLNCSCRSFHVSLSLSSVSLSLCFSSAQKCSRVAGHHRLLLLFRLVPATKLHQ